MKEDNDSTKGAMQSLHSALLEALRHREQEIFSYLAILVPALGGFAWLLLQDTSGSKAKIFLFGTFGVQGMLFLGVLYSLSLGYNFRYLTFQLAKIENSLGLYDIILEGWPRSPDAFKKYTKWCKPPEIIKVFWYAFLFGIALVTGIAISVERGKSPEIVMTGFTGIISFAAGILGPLYFGRKFEHLYKKEKPWLKS